MFNANNKPCPNNCSGENGVSDSVLVVASVLVLMLMLFPKTGRCVVLTSKTHSSQFLHPRVYVNIGKLLWKRREVMRLTLRWTGISFTRGGRVRSSCDNPVRLMLLKLE